MGQLVKWYLFPVFVAFTALARLLENPRPTTTVSHYYHIFSSTWWQIAMRVTAGTEKNNCAGILEQSIGVRNE
jgi:hypothetical protein